MDGMLLDRMGSGSIRLRGGVWHMELDDTCPGVPLPAEVAREMRLGQLIERSYPDSPEAREARLALNCHRAAFHVLGIRHAFSSGWNSTRSCEEAATVSLKLFEMHTEHTLTEEIRHAAKSPPHIVLVQGGHTGYAAHSFIAGVDGRGRVVCADKMSRGMWPFRIVPLRVELGNYKTRSWRVLRRDELPETF